VVVSFESQGGSHVDPITYYFGVPIKLPLSPVRAGYSFGGWFTKPSDGEVIGTGFAFVNGNATLYAHWSPDSNPIVFNTDGGPELPNGSYLTDSPVGTLPAPSRDGYIFKGWVTDDSTAADVDQTYVPATIGGIKLKALWLDRHNQFKVRHLVVFTTTSTLVPAHELFKLKKLKSRLVGMSRIITQVQVWVEKEISKADFAKVAAARAKKVAKIVNKKLHIDSTIEVLPASRSVGYQARHSWATVNVQFLK
jgi:uncharacterized repeat protein (TIGR02543 family)